MNRRKFLGYSAATFGLAALGASAFLHEDSDSFIPRLLHELIGDFAMTPQQEEQFVKSFAESFGTKKLAVMIALYRVDESTGLGTEFTRGRIDRFERALVTEFLTSTDYLRKQHEKNPDVLYVGHKLCSNPFAQFSGLPA